MRNVLSLLEESGRTEAINCLISNFYGLKNAVDRDNLDMDKARRLLREFRETVGDDPIEAAIAKKSRKQAQQKYKDAVAQNQARTNTLEELNNTFLSLFVGGGISPQERGFKLERLFFDLLHFSEIEYTNPYRTTDGEQIDGAFKFEKFDYLVEIKWINGPVKHPELSVFDGKIRGKAQSTRGLFLAANGFDVNAVAKFSGDAPRIVLMTGEDLTMVLNGSIPFYDVMRAKVDAIVRYGNIIYPVRAMLS